MKKVFLILFALAIALPLFAQDKTEKEDKSEMQTLFPQGRKLSHGGYGAPEIKYGQFKGEWGMSVGLKAAWLIDHSLSVGLAGYGVVTSHKLDGKYIDTTPSEIRIYSTYLRTGYGGLYLGYSFWPEKLIHLNVSGLIGAGGAAITKSFNNMKDSDNEDEGKNGKNDMDMGNWTLHNSAYFIFEPGVSVELNVTRFFRLELGASYKIVSGVDMPGVTNKDLGGLNGNFAIKFGAF